ncbi:hypothetical protein BGZ65_005527 [Modicella reniformis]|uniref:Uncharacterized protein n=1 Tax=Modicella reniformis TaxID=1440133 RepID=A0A9P6IN79_9FUNG|nr:hypothetical protein BGZ65_005527 [Modicella reniformis]
MASTFEQDQQLFTDTLLKLQIYSALAKENIQNGKAPLPLVAQSCSLLDNLPTRSPPHWTPEQVNLINSLKMNAWADLADECIRTNDLIQAEASLQRLSALQDTATGPLSLRNKANRQRDRRANSSAPASNDSTLHVNHHTTLSSISGSSEGKSEGKSVSTTMEITKEQRQGTADLIQTWDKLRQVYNDMGQQEMANNFVKRIAKMRERLNDLQ